MKSCANCYHSMPSDLYSYKTDVYRYICFRIKGRDGITKKPDACCEHWKSREQDKKKERSNLHPYIKHLCNTILGTEEV